MIAFVHTSSQHDFCLVRIGADARGLPAAERVQRLSRRPARRGDAIYVVSHPRGEPRQVADAAHVLFPFESTDREVRALTRRLVAAHPAGPYRKALREQLEASYRRGPAGQRRLHSLRFKGQAMLGADCDTFSGSSGGAVFDKRTHALIGILFDGAPDDDTRGPRGWTRHEAIVPASVIADELEAALDVRALGIRIDG